MEQQCWLPQLECIDQYKNDWFTYQEAIYSIFKADFIMTKPLFESKPVIIRIHPIEFGKEEAFFHVTCKDYEKNKNRVPDFRRCERIRWVRSFIENYNCDASLCEACAGIKCWEIPCSGGQRIHLLLEEERYMIVIERRQRYCLLITAFFFDEEHKLRKKLKKHNEYLEQERNKG